jgi:amino acid transporter
MGQVMWAFPGGDFAWANILAIVPTILFFNLVYAFLSISMPRSGGDYIYMSRLVNPAVGFAMSFTVAMSLAYYAGFGALWASGLAVGTFLGTMGYFTGNAGLIAASAALQNTTNLFIVSTILVVVFGLLVMAPLKNYLRVNNVLMVVGAVGMVLALGLLATTTPGVFATKFNTFMLQFTSDKNYYQTIINQAQSAGWNPTPPFSLYSTILMFPTVMSAVGYTYSSVYIGGEVKQVQKNQMLGMIIPLVFYVAFNAIVYWVTLGAVGTAFESSINYLWWQGTPISLPLWPYFNLWATLATSNIALAFLVGIGFLALSIMYVPLNFMLVTRMIFAWSFDRVFPEKMSQVNDRTHSPIWAVVFVMIVTEVFLIIMSYTTILSGLAAAIGLFIANLVGFSAAVLLPYRNRALYESSPIAKYKIGKLPLISVLGAGGMIFALTLIIPMIVDGRYLANSTVSLGIIVGSIAAGFVLYYASLLIRKSKGIDLSLAFKGIPPE